MTQTKRVLAVSSLLLLCSTAHLTAQEQLTEHTLKLSEGGTSPPAKVTDFAWLEGRWRADAFGGSADEIWSSPAAGTMVGLYRLVREGEVSFYEIFTLTEEASTVMLRLKHFHSDLTGWEAQDETIDFPLVAFDDKQASFDGLTYQRRGPDEIQVNLAMRSDNEAARESAFTYRRLSSAH